MPAPGVWVICRPGTAFSHMPFSAPPSGIHDPPCGPVMKVTCCAATGAAKAANAAAISVFCNFIPSSSGERRILAIPRSVELAVLPIWVVGRRAGPDAMQSGADVAQHRGGVRMEGERLHMPRYTQ